MSQAKSTLLHELSQMVAEQIQQATKCAEFRISARDELNREIELVGALIDKYEHIQDLISKLGG